MEQERGLPLRQVVAYFFQLGIQPFCSQAIQTGGKKVHGGPIIEHIGVILAPQLSLLS
jgi:hypothetical protein